MADDLFAGLSSDSAFNRAVYTGIALEYGNVNIFTLVFQIGRAAVISLDCGAERLFYADIHLTDRKYKAAGDQDDT